MRIQHETRAEHEGELAFLHELLRWQIQSFIRPERDGWMTALREAQIRFGAEHGALVFAALARTLDAMRRSRKSPFGSSPPRRLDPASAASDCERLFLQILRETLRHRPERAEAVATLLCEANEVRELLVAASSLCALIDARPAAPR